MGAVGQLDGKVEVLIIGAGAIGICCAHYLREHGAEVMVVEKRDICSGASYGNAGLVVPSYSVPLAAPGVISQSLKWLINPESPFYVKPRPKPSLLRWMWKFARFCNENHVRRSVPIIRDLTRESLRLFKKLSVMPGFDFGFQQKGILELFITRPGFEEGKRVLNLLESFEIGGKVIEKTEIEEITHGVESRAVGGILFEEDALLIPDKFVKQLADHEVKGGLKIETNAEVLSFDVSGSKVRSVRTTKGTIYPDQVVLAAGAWSKVIARDLNPRLMIEPAKGYSVTFKKPQACPEVPASLAEARVVITPMGDTVRFAGMLELAGFDESIDKRRVRAVLRAVAEYLPGLDSQGLDLIEIWQGLRPCTPDGLPYIAVHPKYNNLILASGHGMLGISLAPATGKLVAQILSGDKPFIDISPFQIGRFY